MKHWKTTLCAAAAALLLVSTGIPIHGAANSSCDHLWLPNGSVRSCDKCDLEQEILTSGDWGYVLLDNTAEIAAYYGEAAEPTIPDTIDGTPVTAIGDFAFSDHENLALVTIPNSITAIGANPFLNTSARIQVSPRHPALAVIDGVLFEKAPKRLVSYPYDSSASSYKIPQGILEIGVGAFAGCENLTQISIPDSVTSIGDRAFYYCESLTQISIPDSVTSISDYAFFNCESLTQVTIGNGVTSIGDHAFSYCVSLTQISIPDSVTSIGEGSFSNCESLTQVTIGNGVTSIGDYAFYWCVKLTKITLPNSVTYIGYGAILGFSNLTVTVEADSYAEQYCIDNDLNYTFPDALDWLNS